MRRMLRWLNIGSLMILVCSMLATGCKSYKQKAAELPDTADNGKIYVSADESFKPVIDEQVKVYESNHPGTTIQVTYKPEAECLKDMLVDTVRVVIATRYFTAAEKALVSDSLDMALHNMILARDAIAVIMNPESKDSSFTVNDLRNILQGKFKENLIPVFDGVKATSTVRFIIDSLLHGDTLGPQVVAARSSQEVIDYIARTKNAIGFIGVSWIGNRDDPNQLEFLKKVKIIPLQSPGYPDVFVTPAQQNIYTGNYPLVRDLVYIMKEKHDGLANAFVDFMSGEKGQLIFKRSFLVPAQKDFTYRTANTSR